MVVVKSAYPSPLTAFLWLPSQKGLVAERPHPQNLMTPGCLNTGGVMALPSTSRMTAVP